jgi:hypothetical protein
VYDREVQNLLHNLIDVFPILGYSRNMPNQRDVASREKHSQG